MKSVASLYEIEAIPKDEQRRYLKKGYVSKTSNEFAMHYKAVIFLKTYLRSLRVSMHCPDVFRLRMSFAVGGFSTQRCHSPKGKGPYYAFGRSYPSEYVIHNIALSCSMRLHACSVQGRRHSEARLVRTGTNCCGLSDGAKHSRDAILNENPNYPYAAKDVPLLLHTSSLLLS